MKKFVEVDEEFFMIFLFVRMFVAEGVENEWNFEMIRIQKGKFIEFSLDKSNDLVVTLQIWIIH